MSETPTNVTPPPDLTYGYVDGRIILAIGDRSDAGRMPDPVPADDMTVTLTPANTILKVTTPTPATVIKQPIVCAVDANGYLVDGQGARGVWLVTGTYKVTYSHSRAIIPSHDIEVTTGHTEAAPLDLTTAMPPGGPVLAPSEYAELNGRLTILEAGGGGGGVTDHVFNSTPGLLRFRARFANAATTRVPVIVVGDSITAGAWADGIGGTLDAAKATAWATKGFVGRTRAFLASIYGDTGEGLITLAAEEARWTLTGTSASAACGVASTGRRWTTEGTATISLTCTGIDVIGIRRNGAVGAGLPLTRGGVPSLKVDGVDVTPNILSDSPVSGVGAMTAGWATTLGSLTYVTDAGENVIEYTSTGAGGRATYTPTSSGQRTPATAATTYLATVEVKPIGTAAVHNFRVTAGFYDAAGASLGELTAPDNGSVVADQWSPVTAVVTAPAGTATAALFVRSSALAAGEQVRYRRAKLIPLQWSTPATGDGATGSGVDATIYRYGIDGLATASHTVQLVTSAGTCDVTGLRARIGDGATPGIVVHRAGRSGSATVEHVGSGWSTQTKTDLLNATYDALEAAPALVVIALGANDYDRQVTSGITPAVFEGHIRTLTGRALALGADVLLIAGPRWADDTKAYPQSAYAGALRTVAATTDHVAFFDLSDIPEWADYGAANAAGFMYDSPHPNAAGHGAYASLLESILLAV